MWYNAKIRRSSVGLETGTKVLVAKSDYEHTSIGPCWWVYDGIAFRQIPEALEGRGLYKLLDKGKPFSKQDKIGVKFAKFEEKYAKLWKKMKKPLF
jgi:hypothetical protein